MAHSQFSYFLTSDVIVQGMTLPEALVMHKLREWFRVAVQAGKNFDGKIYYINRTHEELYKDLEFVLSAESIRKIMKSLEKKGFLKIDIDRVNGNKYYLNNQKLLVTLTDCWHYHAKNMSKLPFEPKNIELCQENLPDCPENLPDAPENLPDVSLYLNDKRNDLINDKEGHQDFDTNKKIKTLFPHDLNRIRQHWIDIGLQYKSTAWEFNDLRKIGDIIATHGADIESVLKAITAYSSVINNPDSFYTFKHSISSFFGSKGAWEKFLEGNYFEGQFNKNGLTEYDTEKRIKEIADGINQLNGF